MGVNNSRFEKSKNESGYHNSTAPVLNVGTYQGKTWLMLGKNFEFIYLDDDQHVELLNSLLERIGASERVEVETKTEIVTTKKVTVA